MQTLILNKFLGCLKSSKMEKDIHFFETVTTEFIKKWEEKQSTQYRGKKKDWKGPKEMHQPQLKLHKQTYLRRWPINF